MDDGNELVPIEEDRKAGSALNQAGHALFRLGRIFSRHTMKDQSQVIFAILGLVVRTLYTESINGTHFSLVSFAIYK